MPVEPRRLTRARERGIAVIPLVLLILVCLLAWVYWEPALSGVGEFLNNGEAPKKADAIVVLAGGWRGERIEAASDLKAKGYAPLVVVSGTVTLYGQKECPMALAYLQAMGRTTDGYVCAESGANSSKEESETVIEALRQRGVKRALVVSCDTHMRRAGRLWRNAAPDIELTFVPAPSRNFDLKRWYGTREGWKSVVMEWAKLLTSYIGI